MTAEQLAKFIHDTSADLSPEFKGPPVKPWDELPQADKNYRIAIAQKTLEALHKEEKLPIIYTRKECQFNYCPEVKICKSTNTCIHKKIPNS